jgi:hypothetical protein
MLSGIALYAILAVIWFVRLEGKVRANKELFLQFQEHSKEKDEKIEHSIDKLFDIVRKVEKIANNLEGRLNINIRKDL